MSDSEARCPVLANPHTARGSATNQHWWPNKLNLKMLRQNAPQSDPMGEDFDYAEELETLDVAALKKDVAAVLTTSQDWCHLDALSRGDGSPVQVDIGPPPPARRRLWREEENA